MMLIFAYVFTLEDTEIFSHPMHSYITTNQSLVAAKTHLKNKCVLTKKSITC